MSSSGNKYYASNGDGSIFCMLAQVPHSSGRPLATFHLMREIKGAPDQKIGEISARLVGGKTPYLANFQLNPGFDEKVGHLLYTGALKYLREETEYLYARIETLHDKDVLRKCAILANFEKLDEYIADRKKIIVYRYDLEFMRHAPDLMRLIDYQIQKRVETPSLER